MIGKILAALVMGVVVALLAKVVVGMAFSNDAVGMGGALAGFVAMCVLAYTATRGRYAWGRGFLFGAVLSFALPLAGIVSAVFFGAGFVGKAGSDAKVSAAFAATAMGAVETIVLTVVGGVFGAIFLVAANSLLRTPPVSAATAGGELPAPGGPTS